MCQAFSNHWLKRSVSLAYYTMVLSNGSAIRGIQPPRFKSRFDLRCFQVLSAWRVAARQCNLQPVD